MADSQRWYQGSPCQRGHPGLRYLANGACITCNDAHARRAAEKRREYYQQKAAEYRDRNREYIRAQRENPCTDCGQSYPWYVMEFDHLEPASRRVGEMVGWPLAAVKEEIAKCELVCANCHKARTHARREAPTPKE